MMQSFLEGAKSFDSADVSGSEALQPMRGFSSNANGHSSNTLDSEGQKQHEDFADEQNKQNWQEGNTVLEAGPAADWGSIFTSGGASAQNDPSLCSTPPRTRIDPDQSGSLDPPGTNGTGRAPKSPPGIVKSTNSGFHSFFRRPMFPPGPEESDDEIKESLVMENHTQGWFGGLITPERKKQQREMDGTTLPETPPEKEDFTPVSSVELNGDEHEDGEDSAGCKVASDQKTVKVRLIYFMILFFFLMVIIVGLATFLWYLNDLEKEQASQVRDFVATMRPTSLITKEPSMEPTTGPSISASPTLTAYPTKSPTRQPTPQPTKRPTRRPTELPTKTPTNYPTMETPFIDFMRIMAEVSPDTALKMESPGTPHYNAFHWLAKDPSYYSYDTDRKIQRWVLAFIKLSFQVTPPETEQPSSMPSLPPSSEPTLTPTTSPPTVFKPTPFWNFQTAAAALPNDDDEGRRLNWYALESWMQYTDECQWFGSYWFNKVACNWRKQFVRLILINVELEGTIPSEIALLSRLDTIMLPINKLTGTIPTEFGSMRWLHTFNVSYNSMSGSLPKALTAAPALGTLDVGNNNFTAPVPNEYCQKGLKVFRGDCAKLSCPCCNRCAR